ncbi:MAG: 1-(5-phosphoribosyl)-5-[(5-phosphoribosylamino)methylideneamino]imidazole-4-carboxamide isomerase [Deltaproteobacteria bacterium]|nr:1-(5-phosphoribosyl)-5-[(5-phosphoribosylamino)methylideneamino]imidazole-4-carboxamide isomerase [Deltaproteobacteria bacterium]MBW1952865.1 1-(5-phosphoribosyl)-5-[(5-phosphoribosylamino)methylideneamino]imidazole-4-carboxamide isomerase [Deltaproteobacteria bacterium]MBW1985863.1 1-(5-phosphoribosyl)-5-[(5-phosphoribosylamino)methylideneamino]imidazole-4-carboxamide isomerase [Deltaproteobacteria bacterium]MBW2133623.1 1-(5-phosphoribosyl)-5-[(5-phosphoribosylamino)methylideneamino]imidazo
MLIIPAVDLKGGKCVRLRQGVRDQETVYSDDPVAMGRRWEDEGAGWLHVVDLDGAFSQRPVNQAVIRRLRQSLHIPIQLGGGLRTMESLAVYLDLGIDRVILGTAVLKDPELVAQACARYPGQIAIALDAREGRLAVEGWTEDSARDAVQVAVELAPLKPAVLIYTDIQRDGMQTGPNIAATQRLAQAVPLPVIASGGVSTLEDIKNLLPLEADGVIGVITGRALYAGTLDFRAALKLAVG